MDRKYFLLDISGFPNLPFSGSEGQGQPPSANYLEKAIVYSLSFAAYTVEYTDQRNTSGWIVYICMM